jgi:LemA protein
MLIVKLRGGKMALEFILLAIAVVVAVVIIAEYNLFILYNQRIKNAFSQIDVQLARRADLIPNLIASVKGYVKHESTLLKDIAKVRSEGMKASSIGEKASADIKMHSLLSNLFVAVEAYPTLKANENFLLLQEEITGTEDKIAYSRQFYNDTVMQFNILVERFPSSILASVFKFTMKEFFEAKEKQKKNVNVAI